MIGLDEDLGTVQEIGISMVETRAEVEIGDRGPGVLQEIEKDQIPGLDLAPMLVQIGIDSDVIDAVNMTIL